MRSTSDVNSEAQLLWTDDKISDIIKKYNITSITDWRINHIKSYNSAFKRKVVNKFISK